MAEERFRRVAEYLPSYSIPDSPVEILKGAILLDTLNNSVILQLKLFNNSYKALLSTHISIDCFDDTGERLTKEGPIFYSYQDLNVAPQNSFGERSAIPIPDNRTRKVEITIIKAKMANGEVTEISSLNKIELPKAERIESLGDNLVKKYKRVDPKDNKFTPAYIPKMLESNYWLCTCGKVNADAAMDCQRCGRKKELQFKEISSQYLTNSLQNHNEELQQVEELKRQQDLLNQQDRQKQESARTEKKHDTEK